MLEAKNGQDPYIMISKKIKLVYIMASFKQYGGAQRALYLLISKLDRQKYIPCVVCLGIDEYYAQAYRELGVKAKVYNTNIFNGIFVLFNLFFLLRREKPDIVQTYLFHADIIGRFLAKLAGVPIIISSIRCTNVYKKWRHLILDKLTAGIADKITFVTKKSIEFSLRHEGIKPEQVVVIPNGIDTQAYENNPANNSMRKELDIKDGYIIVGGIGRLDKQKGFSCLIKAVPIMLQQQPKTVFIILGKGALERKLKELAKSLGLEANIKFLVPPQDVPQFLHMLDIFVLPSLYEGLSNSLLEAMAAGKPIVATNVDGSLEALDDKSGILVPPGDEKELAEAILRLIEDKGLRQALGNAARKRVKEKFSLDKMIAEYQKLYDDLCAEKIGCFH
jgi:glycosyltransferase involved in cell wall biosynthesis